MLDQPPSLMIRHTNSATPAYGTYHASCSCVPRQHEYSTAAGDTILEHTVQECHSAQQGAGSSRTASQTVQAKAPQSAQQAISTGTAHTYLHVLNAICAQQPRGQQDVLVAHEGMAALVQLREDALQDTRRAQHRAVMSVQPGQAAAGSCWLNGLARSELSPYASTRSLENS